MKGSSIVDWVAGNWQLGNAAGPRWIFPERPDGSVNQFVDFLHVFDCHQLQAGGGLRISADTDFVVWLNGRCLGGSQYSNYPDQKTYEYFLLEGLMRSGRNTLAVTVFYNGSDSSVYRRGQPGLVFEIQGDGKSLAASGCKTICRTNPCYHSGPIAKVSGQLFYTFGYDARGDDGFYLEEYVPGEEWTAMRDNESLLPEGRRILSPRPVERLIEGSGVPAVIKAAGYFRRDRTGAGKKHNGTVVADTSAGLMLAEGTNVSIAWQMQNDHLSAASTFEMFKLSPGVSMDKLSEGLAPAAVDKGDNDGIYLVVDMGREEAGHLALEIEAASGVCVDIGYGEHLEDLRVRTFVGGRNFAARYICREGKQVFTHRFQRWSGRYLQMHIHTAAFRLYKLTLNSSEYPIENRGMIQFGANQLPAEIEKVSRRTLSLCMHEHYEDTPWREQALYANDARTQALCGYYAFGDARFPATSFDLLGRGLRSDGFLELTAPARPRVTIPSFTLVWMLAVRDHYLYSGDDSLARAFLPQILSMLNAFLAERREGLLPLRRAPGIWHFYDWSGGMSGYSEEQLSAGLETDAPLNCFLILAIEAALEIIRWLGEKVPESLEKGLKEIRQSAGDSFWDAGEGAFRTHSKTTVLTQLTQALAVLAGVGSDKQRHSAMSRMSRDDSKLAEPGLSQSFYTYQACMKYRDICGTKVLADIEDKWGMMLKAGATSFWETVKGACDFHNAGSLCHGWSAVPLYVYYHDILGVQPLEPGFRLFAIEPFGGKYEACSGRVPVPGGEIRLDWTQCGEKLDFTYQAPDKCKVARRQRAGVSVAGVGDPG